MPSVFTPPDESEAQLQHDRSWIDGLALSGMAYGVHAGTFCACLYFLAHRQQRRQMTWILFLFVLALFAAGTVMFVALTHETDRMFVTERAYPGGPVSWYNNVGAFDRWTVADDVAYFVAEIVADGLLLYRTWLIWERNLLILVGPSFLYLTVIGLGLPLMCVPTTWNNLHVVEAWFSCAVALNILLTVLIVGRLLVHWRHATQILGPQRGAAYLSVAAIIAESAAPYALFNIAYLVTYVTDSPGANITWPLLSQVMCIAPEVIILRVALGHAWVDSSHTIMDSTVTVPDLRHGRMGRDTDSGIDHRQRHHWDVSTYKHDHAVALHPMTFADGKYERDDTRSSDVGAGGNDSV